MNLEQEKELVERARYSAEAFGELYDMYHDRILAYALRRCANVDAARDVTSAVFFKALRHIRGYRWEGIPFSHWLYRIASREILDHYDKRKRETSYEIVTTARNQGLRGELVAAENELRKYEDYLDLQNYISRLPSKYQEVIALKYFEDKEIREIAEILGKPEGTVKSLLHRSIEKLRKLMEP